MESRQQLEMWGDDNRERSCMREEGGAGGRKAREERKGPIRSMAQTDRTGAEVAQAQSKEGRP